MKRVDVAIGIVYRNGQVLICRRLQQARLGGYWEFPGGKVESGETATQCLERELREELDIAADPLVSFACIDHNYPDVHVRLHPFLCAHRSGEPKPLGCEELRWIDPGELRDYQFPPANGDLLDQVIRHLGK